MTDYVHTGPMPDGWVPSPAVTALIEALGWKGEWDDPVLTSGDLVAAVEAVGATLGVERDAEIDRLTEALRQEGIRHQMAETECVRLRAEVERLGRIDQIPALAPTVATLREMADHAIDYGRATAPGKTEGDWCPHCGVAPEEPCVTGLGQVRTDHASRRRGQS